jgi:hypothetical protein
VRCREKTVKSRKVRHFSSAVAVAGWSFFDSGFRGKGFQPHAAPPGAGGTIANEFDSCQVECLYRAGPGVPRSPAPATVTAPERTEVRSVTKSTLQSHFRFALIHLKFACASSAAPPLAVDISATWSFHWLLTESIRHYGGAEHSGRHEFRGENFQVRAPSGIPAAEAKKRRRRRPPPPVESADRGGGVGR